MKYSIEGAGEIEGRLIKKTPDNSYTLEIGGRERQVKLIGIDSGGIEFIMDSVYHQARYLEISTAKMSISIDGTDMDLGMHSHLDDIVYKNSGGGASKDSQLALRSQIPGKVVSIAADAGSQVEKGDIVCTMESMKMQVGVKAHKSGVVKSVKVSKGDSVAKGDIIAEIE